MKAFLIAVVVIVAIAAYAVKLDNDLTKQVKSGQKILTCNLQQGETQISPDKIVGFSDGRWYFTNGSATQCTIH